MRKKSAMTMGGTLALTATLMSPVAAASSTGTVSTILGGAGSGAALTVPQQFADFAVDGNSLLSAQRNGAYQVGAIHETSLTSGTETVLAGGGGTAPGVSPIGRPARSDQLDPYSLVGVGSTTFFLDGQSRNCAVLEVHTGNIELAGTLPDCSTDEAGIGLAADGAGDVFIERPRSIDEIVAGSNSPEQVVSSDQLFGATDPDATLQYNSIAVDGSSDLYVGSATQVLEVPAASTSDPDPAAQSLFTTVGSILGLASTAAGQLFAVDDVGTLTKRDTDGTTTTVPTFVPAGENVALSPLALTDNGDILLGNGSPADAVYERSPSGTWTQIAGVTSGIGGLHRAGTAVPVMQPIVTVDGTSSYVLYDDDILKIDSHDTTTLLAAVPDDSQCLLPNQAAVPSTMTTGPDHTIYVTDEDCIFRISADGKPTRIAGPGSVTKTGNGGPATKAWLGARGALSMAADSDGDLFFSEIPNLASFNGSVIREIRPDGIIKTLNRGIPAEVLAFDGRHTLYLQRGDYPARIGRINLNNGHESNLAQLKDSNCQTDPGSLLAGPTVDGAGDLFVVGDATAKPHDQCVLERTATGQVSTVIAPTQTTTGDYGDDGQLADAGFSNIEQLQSGLTDRLLTGGSERVRQIDGVAHGAPAGSRKRPAVTVDATGSGSRRRVRIHTSTGITGEGTLNICTLDGQRLARCYSGMRLPHLNEGRHHFAVTAIGIDGLTSNHVAIRIPVTR